MLLKRRRGGPAPGLMLLVGMLLLASGVWLWRRWIALVADVVVTHGVSNEWPVEVPQQAQGGDPRLQMTSDGVGPLFHRWYRVDFSATQVTAPALMQRVQSNIQDFCPTALAEFIKTKGDPTVMGIGDEYQIKILGPWNGIVRVVDVQADSFALMTLEGHPEAGQIRFRLLPSPMRSAALRFEILSWARSRDQVVDLGYRTSKIGSEIQKSAWIEFCRRVAKASGGKRLGKINVLTEERAFEQEVVPRE